MHIRHFAPQVLYTGTVIWALSLSVHGVGGGQGAVVVAFSPTSSAALLAFLTAVAAFFVALSCAFFDATDTSLAASSVVSALSASRSSMRPSPSRASSFPAVLLPD